MSENADYSRGTTASRESIIGAFEEQLGEVPQDDGSVTRSRRTLDNTASHDFAFYEYLLPTEEGYRQAYGELSDKGLAYLDQLESQGISLNQLESLASFLEQLESVIASAVYATVGPPDSNLWIQRLVDLLYDDYR